MTSSSPPRFVPTLTDVVTPEDLQAATLGKQSVASGLTATGPSRVAVSELPPEVPPPQSLQREAIVRQMYSQLDIALNEGVARAVAQSLPLIQAQLLAQMKQELTPLIESVVMQMRDSRQK